VEVATWSRRNWRRRRGGGRRGRGQLVEEEEEEEEEEAGKSSDKIQQPSPGGELGPKKFSFI